MLNPKTGVDRDREQTRGQPAVGRARHSVRAAPATSGHWIFPGTVCHARNSSAMSPTLGCRSLVVFVLGFGDFLALLGVRGFKAALVALAFVGEVKVVVVPAGPFEETEITGLHFTVGAFVEGFTFGGRPPLAPLRRAAAALAALLVRPPIAANRLANFFISLFFIVFPSFAGTELPRQE
jgi:hypothetical protein